MMLTSILTPEARERLNRVSLVKPENARAVEDHLIRLARAGKISSKVN
jgi:programmed cell death protein 5